MNFFSKLLSRSYFIAKSVMVNVLQYTADMRPYRAYRKALESYPQGTVGREVANYLRRTNSDFIPGFEAHEFKHVLIGYENSFDEELRLQAFMLGNGNYSPFCLFFLSAGIFQWKKLSDHFRAGRKCVSIVRWKLEDVAHMPLNRLRHIMYSGMPLNPGDMKVRK